MFLMEYFFFCFCCSCRCLRAAGLSQLSPLFYLAVDPNCFMTQLPFFLKSCPGYRTHHSFYQYDQQYANAWTVHPHVITEHVILILWALFCYSKPLHFWFQAFHQILETGCRDLLLFSQNSISEIQQCAIRLGLQSTIQFIPEVFGWVDGVEIWALCSQSRLNCCEAQHIKTSSRLKAHASICCPNYYFFFSFFYIVNLMMLNKKWLTKKKEKNINI